MIIPKKEKWRWSVLEDSYGCPSEKISEKRNGVGPNSLVPQKDSATGQGRDRPCLVRDYGLSGVGTKRPKRLTKKEGRDEGRLYVVKRTRYSLERVGSRNAVRILGVQRNWRKNERKSGRA